MDLSIIRERMGQLETFKQENKVGREALRNELENNQEYLAVCEEIKALNLKKKRIKDSLLAKPETQKLMSDIKENNEELTILDEILSSELTEYYTEKKTDEIEDKDGDLRKFKLVAKIMPKKDKYDDRDDEGKYAKIDQNIVGKN